MIRTKIGLPAKFILSISAVIILTSVALSWFFIKNQIVQVKGALKNRGKTLVRNLAYNSEYGVLTANQEILLNLIKGLIKEEDVVYCSVQDREGEVLVLAGAVEEEVISGEIGKAILNELREGPLVRFYLSKKGEPIYDIASPIKTQRIERRREEIGFMGKEIEEKPRIIEERIGVARVGISLVQMNRQIDGLKKIAILLTFIVIVIGILVAILLVRIIVKPIRQLLLGTQRIAGGDLAYRVEVRSRDEIGELTDSFNQMTQNLKKTTTSVINLNKEIAVRKQAEEKIKQMAEEWEITFNSITDLISIQDRDFRTIKVNKAYADALKMKPEEIIGKACYEVFCRRKEPWPNCPHKQVMETKKPVVIEFFESHLGIYFENTVSPIFNEEGEVIGSVHVAKDITERKLAQEQEKVLMKDLEETNRIMVGRELRMIELKEEVNKLNKELKIPEPYDVS